MYINDTKWVFIITKRGLLASIYKLVDGSILHYHQTKNIRCTLVGNILNGHSDVVGASRVGASPIASSLPT